MSARAIRFIRSNIVAGAFAYGSWSLFAPRDECIATAVAVSCSSRIGWPGYAAASTSGAMLKVEGFALAASIVTFILAYALVGRTVRRWERRQWRGASRRP